MIKQYIKGKHFLTLTSSNFHCTSQNYVILFHVNHNITTVSTLLYGLFM